MCVGVYVCMCVWECIDVCGDVFKCVLVYLNRHTWAKGNREPERKPVTRKEIKSAKVQVQKSRSAKIQAQKTRSANAKARNLRSKKERESANAKGFAGSAKTQKSACPALHSTVVLSIRGSGHCIPTPVVDFSNKTLVNSFG
jgi:hypothetical protein